MTHTTFDDSHEKQTAGDLDQLLTDYYGPPLKEQPLPSTAWLDVQGHLTRRRRLPRVHFPRRIPHLRRHAPFYLQESLHNVLGKARQQDALFSPRLCYHPRRRRMLPIVGVSLWWPSTLHVTAGRGFERMLGQQELEVLTASALARSHCYRRPAHLLISRLLGLLILASAVALSWLLWKQDVSWLFWLSLVLLVGSLALLWRHKYRLAFLADALVVNWLGRERTCQGLRGLMDHSAYPRCPGWAEPSLAARVRRVCVQPIATPSERLTPVP